MAVLCAAARADLACLARSFDFALAVEKLLKMDDIIYNTELLKISNLGMKRDFNKHKIFMWIDGDEFYIIIVYYYIYIFDTCLVSKFFLVDI